MIILEKELNTRYVKNIVVIEQENNLKMVLFNTHKKMIPFHRASDDVYIFGYDGDTEIVQISELKNINPNCDWMVYYNQDEDQVEILYIPFDMFDDSRCNDVLYIKYQFRTDNQYIGDNKMEEYSFMHDPRMKKFEEIIKKNNRLEPLVSKKIADLIDAYERAEISTTKEFAEKVYSLGYNDHLGLMNKALQSENIFAVK